MIWHAWHQVHNPHPPQFPGINRVAIAGATHARSLALHNAGCEHDFVFHEAPIISMNVAIESRKLLVEKCQPLSRIVRIVSNLAGTPCFGIIDPTVVLDRVLVMVNTHRLRPLDIGGAQSDGVVFGQDSTFGPLCDVALGFSSVHAIHAHIERTCRTHDPARTAHQRGGPPALHNVGAVAIAQVPAKLQASLGISRVNQRERQSGDIALERSLRPEYGLCSVLYSRIDVFFAHGHISRCLYRDFQISSLYDFEDFGGQHYGRYLSIALIDGHSWGDTFDLEAPLAVRVEFRQDFFFEISILSHVCLGRQTADQEN